MARAKTNHSRNKTIRKSTTKNTGGRKHDPEYEWVQENIDFLIRQTKISNDYIVEFLGIGRSTFFGHKREPWDFRLDQLVALGRLFGIEINLLLSEPKILRRWWDGDIT